MPREFKLSMDEEQVGQELSILVTDLSLLYRKYFNRQVREVGLTSVQWQLLSCLARNDGITQTEVADILYKGKSPIGKTLDSLESAGWIKREPGREDRRIKNIYLTDKMAAIQDSLLDVINGMNSIAEAELDSVVEQVRTGLAKIRQNLLDELEE